MKFKSALITVGSGSVGGLTASHNRGGNYFRARTIPTNPKSTYQETIRTTMSSIAALWSGLSAVQRQGWIDYAAAVSMLDKLGDARYLSGQQHFMRSNVGRVAALTASEYTPDAPTTLDLGAAPVISSGAAEIQLDGTINLSGNVYTSDAPVAGVTGDYTLVYLSAMQDAGINYFAGPYRYVDKVAIGASGAQPATMAIATTRTYGQAAGKTVYLHARNSRNDGRLSYATTVAIVTTLAP